jgi:hypothetical protein
MEDGAIVAAALDLAEEGTDLGCRCAHDPEERQVGLAALPACST